MILLGRQACVLPTVMSGLGICPRIRYELTVATPTPRYAATSDVVHHSAEGSGSSGWRSEAVGFRTLARLTCRPMHDRSHWSTLRRMSQGASPLHSYGAMGLRCALAALGKSPWAGATAGSANVLP
jgi:hypothetical protein